MQEVRDAGPDDRDRIGQEPVGEGPVAAGAELQHEPDDEHEHLDAAAFEVAVGLQVVRRGLAAGGRQDLHHPEEEDDLRDLGRDRRGKEATDQRQLGVPLAQIPRLDHSLQDNRSALDINQPRGPNFRCVAGSSRVRPEVDTQVGKDRPHGRCAHARNPYGDRMIEVRGVTKRYGEKRRRRRSHLHGQARDRDRLPRPERRRQVDHDAADPRPRRADERDGDGQRQAPTAISRRRCTRSARCSRPARSTPAAPPTTICSRWPRPTASRAAAWRR